MKRRFVFAFALLLSLGLSGSVALAQGFGDSVETTGTETASPLPTDSATLTPTPTATPSSEPMLVVTVDEGPAPIDPAWVFLFGALIGAAALSLAEVSALSYLKKNPKLKK